LRVQDDGAGTGTFFSPIRQSTTKQAFTRSHVPSVSHLAK
jgi:hypothetical protein